MTKYIGSQPATSFEAVKKDRFTGLTGTGVTLSHSVSSVQDIVVWVNNVKQDYNNYTVSGTALTLGGSLVSADVVQVLYVGRTFQTVNPSAASVGNNEVASTIITGQTAETSVATDDLILLSDTSASGALKKMTRANFVSGIGGTMTPMFYANQQSGTTQSISANTFTKLNMGTEDFDTASNYDTSNSRFTPQTSGKYWVFGAVMFATGTDISQIECGIYKNGSLIALNISPNDSYNNSYVTTILSLNGSSDYIELYAKHNASGSQTTATYNDGRYVKFGAYKIIE